MMMLGTIKIKGLDKPDEAYNLIKEKITELSLRFVNY